MREIKFRGIRKDTGVWIFGNLLIPNMVLRGEYICDSIGYIDFYPSFEEGDDIKKWDGIGIAVGQFHEILPETKGQFTGLLDKNGKEIYEGDVIKHDDPNWGYGGKYDKENDSYLYHDITFEDGCFCLRDNPELHIYNKMCEVIGNIYENKNLI